MEGRKHRKIVHFDRLKLCPNNIRLKDSGGGLPSQEPNGLPPPSVSDRVLPIGHKLELLDDPGEDDGPAVPTQADQNDTAPLAAPVDLHPRRYPRRDHCVPNRYDDFVPLHHILDNMRLLQKKGGDVTV